MQKDLTCQAVISASIDEEECLNGNMKARPEPF